MAKRLMLGLFAMRALSGCAATQDDILIASNDADLNRLGWMVGSWLGVTRRLTSSRSTTPAM